jgi:superfamily I DNA and RNA helicase
MYNIGSWNIRGLNGSSKYKAVNDHINNPNLSLVGTLETKIASNHMRVKATINPFLWHMFF